MMGRRYCSLLDLTNVVEATADVSFVVAAFAISVALVVSIAP